jgi:hypothetical protein
MARIQDWLWIESAWKNVLREKNKELRKSGRQQISRFHAADCSSCKGEFNGWGVDEQIAFSKKLLGIFKRYLTSVIAYTFPVDEFKAVFPQHANNPYPQMYGFLVKFIMLQLIEEIEKDGRVPTSHVCIALLHDRSSHDSDMHSAFNFVMNNDPTFTKQRYFSSITSIGWESCIPLQAADLIAYETFKDIDNKAAGRNRRKSLTSILESDNFGGRSKIFNRANLEALRDGFDSPES